MCLPRPVFFFFSSRFPWGRAFDPSPAGLPVQADRAGPPQVQLPARAEEAPGGAAVRLQAQAGAQAQEEGLPQQAVRGGREKGAGRCRLSGVMTEEASREGGRVGVMEGFCGGSRAESEEYGVR